MAEPHGERVVVCRVGAERFSLPVAAVREVVASPVLARIPGAPPAVRGLANVRGTLITAVSAPILLGFSDALPTEWLVVLARFGGRVGLEVDEVEDLHAGADVPGLPLEALLDPLFGSESPGPESRQDD
ncbi:MAG TPA: chemotaxis protein CheW [Gemmatimonadales bacterium]|jgi:chemotaxis signal transduction protein|nr:chemotaxis protein CheW [Gemmatimonadales bacterium]